MEWYDFIIFGLAVIAATGYGYLEGHRAGFLKGVAPLHGEGEVAPADGRGPVLDTEKSGVEEFALVGGEAVGAAGGKLAGGAAEFAEDVEGDVVHAGNCTTNAATRGN